jgi:outer membrane protein OmpA-like peptidoglycan-associated protein
MQSVNNGSVVMCQMHRLAASALSAAFLVTAADADPGGIKVGTLTCHVEGGWGYVLGSSKDIDCAYNPDHGGADRYVGSLSKFGVDIGYTRGATLVWAVIAPTSDVGPGALQGDYAGATASATVIDGVGANALVGGFDRSIALQPVSIEGTTGYFDVAAGVGEMSLEAAPPPVPRQAAYTPPPSALPAHFAVFFDFNRSTLTPEARSIVQAAVADAERTGMVKVRVTGHTDTVGSESYNQRLSVKRANAVKAEMVQDGLDGRQIAIEGRGFHDPLVPTGPGVREPQNRRAVIDLGNTTVSENRL